MMTQLRINMKEILTNANELESFKRKAFSNWITKQNQQKQEIYLTQCDSERSKIKLQKRTYQTNENKIQGHVSLYQTWLKLAH